MLGVLPGIIGTIQTTEALKLILGIGESLAGRLLLVDALRMSFRTLNLRKDPECPACGTHEITELIDYEEFCGVRQAAAADAAAQSAVPEITPAQLAARIARGDDFDLIDVREPHEWDIARIPGARLIPLSTVIEALPTLDSARDIVVHCKVGGTQRQGRAAAAGIGIPESLEPRRRHHALERRRRSERPEILESDMHTAELPARGAVTPSPTVRALPQHCKVCGAEFDAAPEAICGSCLGPLEPMYPASRRLPSRAEIAARAPSMWRYREWLPFEGAPTLSLDTGFTPLVDAPRLADRLGVAQALDQERCGVASVALVQGSRRRIGDQCRDGVRSRHGGLCLHRKSRECRRRARGARGIARLDLHPGQSRAGEGARHARCTDRISCAYAATTTT